MRRQDAIDQRPLKVRRGEIDAGREQREPRETDRLPAVEEGDTVFVAFAPEDAHLFDASSGERLA